MSPLIQQYLLNLMKKKVKIIIAYRRRDAILVFQVTRKNIDLHFYQVQQSKKRERQKY